MKKPFFALWVLTLGLFVFSWVYLPGISKYRDLKIKQDQLEDDFHSMEEKVKAIREERDLLKNDVQYLEKVIRDELGLVKPGEVVYKFVPEPPKKEVPAAAQPEAESAKPKAPQIATAGTSLKKAPSVMNAAAQAVSSASGPKTVPEISPENEDQAAEGQVAAPAALASSIAANPAGVDINVSEPTETDEPVYPRRELR